MAIEYTNGVPNVRYNDTQGWYDAWNKYRSQTGQYNNPADDSAANEMTRYGDTFSSQFKQLVGRDPNQIEFGKFWNEVVVPRGNFVGDAATQQLQDQTKNFVSSNFQREAEEQVNNELQAQQQQANSLADLFRTQSAGVESSYQNSLLDFTNKLIERVRPNLMISLQSQGLLNSGGLNQAIAGQQADLARDAGQQVADLKLQNDQQANAIAFGGAAAPYEFQKAQSMNRLPYLQGQGESSINRMFQTRLMDQQFQNQMALQKDARGGKKGSFWDTFGQSTASSIGQNIGSAINPASYFGRA
jgi:hypothetical protein